MKAKELFIILFILIINLTYGQRYKLEAQISIIRVGSGNLNGMYLSGVDTNNNLVHNLIYIENSGTRTKDIVFTSGYNIDKIQNWLIRGEMPPLQSQSIQTYIPQVQPDCFPLLLNNSFPNFGAEIIYLRLVKLDLLSDLNPLINLELKECEPKTLNIFNSCGYNISYAIEYSIGTNQWNDLLTYGEHPESFTFTFSDIPSLVIGNNLNIRVRYTPTNTSLNSYSQTITFNTIECSPQLLDFTSTETLCSYSNDGGFSMILDRDIPIGDELVVSLYFKNVIDGTFGLQFQTSTSDPNGTTTLIDNGDGTFTYQWPINLFPIQTGIYKVKYQTHGTTVPNEPWDSLVFSPEFTVGSPPPVFISGSSQDVNCFNGSDGIIQLNATGGAGSYIYEINGNNNWIPFSNPNTHTISNNTQGVYNIKIKDANGCTEQQ